MINKLLAEQAAEKAKQDAVAAAADEEKAKRVLCDRVSIFCCPCSYGW